MIRSFDCLELLRALAHGEPMVARHGYTGTKPSRSDRLRQLLHGVWASVRMFFGMRGVVVTGRHLTRMSGPVTISSRAGWREIIGALLKDKALLFFPLPGGSSDPVRAFCDRLPIDASRSITVRLTGNEVLTLGGEFGGEPVIAHLPIRKHGAATVRRHRCGLLQAQAILETTDLIRLLPGIRSWRDDHDLPILLQSRLPGRTPDPVTMTNSAFVEAIQLAMEPLKALHGLARRRTAVDEPDFISRYLTAFYHALPNAYAKRIEGIIAHLEHWSSRRTLPSVPLHGDYWLSNTMLDAAGSRLVGIIDWEWFSADGLPALDAVHLLVVSYASHRGHHVGDVTPSIWRRGAADSWMDRQLGDLPATFGISDQDLKFVGIVFWLDYIRRGYIETTPPDAQWLPRIVEPSAAAIEGWLAKNAD
jgi:hypothetical protein